MDVFTGARRVSCSVVSCSVEAVFQTEAAAARVNSREVPMGSLSWDKTGIFFQ